jgi:hypothetical protein
VELLNDIEYPLYESDQSQKYQAGCSRVEAFWRTLVVDCYDSHQIGATDLTRGRVPDELALSLDKKPIEGDPTYGHRILLSQQGFLGMAPPRTQNGDIIAVLFGALFPPPYFRLFYTGGYVVARISSDLSQ